MPRRFRETVSGDRESAESRLRTRLDASLRRVYGLRGFESALSEERASMMREVRADLKTDAELLGLNIEDVRIRRTDLTQEVSQQTFERMKAERLAEAELIRARGNEKGQTRRAVADRQVVEFVAEAQRDSEILRGEGEAERTAVFADAFARDPKFFEFYRSMTAYGRRSAARTRRWCCRRTRNSSAISTVRTGQPLRPPLSPRQETDQRQWVIF